MAELSQYRSPDQGRGRVLAAGERLEQARAVVLACHGRGAGAEDIIGVAAELGVPAVTVLAPEAPGRTWYPNSFLAPIPSNEPWLSSALSWIGELVSELETRGVPADRVVLLGFSQGACLTLEYAARNARRYGAVVGWSGGLIGPPGTPRDYGGSLSGTPVFLGCSDTDPHVPAARVRETAEVLRRLGGEVDMRIYPGLGHTVDEDELEAARQLVSAVAAGVAER
jgi:predicted esterase